MSFLFCPHECFGTICLLGLTQKTDVLIFVYCSFAILILFPHLIVIVKPYAYGVIGF